MLRPALLLILLLCLAQPAHPLPRDAKNTGTTQTRSEFAMLNNLPFAPRPDLMPEKYIRSRRSYTVLTPIYSILDDIF